MKQVQSALRGRDGGPRTHQMSPGFSVYQLEGVHPRCRSVVLYVLLHFHVLRVGHEEGVRCLHGLFQLVKLWNKRTQSRECFLNLAWRIKVIALRPKSKEVVRVDSR